jgi:hypothetical protein
MTTCATDDGKIAACHEGPLVAVSSRTFKCEVDAGVFVEVPAINKEYLHDGYTEQSARDDACSIARTTHQAGKPKTYHEASSVPHGPLIEPTFWLLIAALVAVSGLWSWKKMRGAGRGSS